MAVIKPPDIKVHAPYDPNPRVEPGADIARVLLRPGQYDRPTLSIPGGIEFEWPGGTEGWSEAGAITLGIHKYLDSGVGIDVQVLHRDEMRLTMSGMFPGLTGATNARRLREVIRRKGPVQGKSLFVPGVFNDILRVYVESYNFEHPVDGDGFSVNYSVVFLVAGNTNLPDDDDSGLFPPPNPLTATAGTSSGVFIVSHNYNTLPKIAKHVYGSADKWTKLYSLNVSKLTTSATGSFPNVSASALMSKVLPIGMKLVY